jgi:competence protein ComEA
MSAIRNRLSKTRSVVMKSIFRPLLILLSVFILGGAVYVQAAEPEADTVVMSGVSVNVNTADAELIAEVLKGIGLKKAQAIVAWREKHGKFTAVEQLTEIKGVGESTLAKNEGRITLN